MSARRLPGLHPGLWLAAVLLAATGCGKKGPPLPPEPRGPQPPAQVRARQVNGKVEVWFTPPEPRGPRPDHVPVAADLIRVDYPPGVTPPSDPGGLRRRGHRLGRVALPGGASGKRVRIEDETWRELEGGGLGWVLRYAVRVLDGKGRPSPWVLAEDFVPGPVPEPPGSLRGEATADGVLLRWEPARGGPLLGYHVYRAEGVTPYGELPQGSAVVEGNEYLDSGVMVGRTYRYHVRAVAAADRYLRESAPGPEIRVLAEDRFPPAAPTGLVAVQEGAAVRLFWNPVRDRDLAGYWVYRRAPGGQWRRLGEHPVRETRFLDAEVPPGARRQYRVTAVDRADPPNESEPSETVEIVVSAVEGSQDRTWN